MTNQHTPGPWWVDDDPRLIGPHIEADEDCVAYVYCALGEAQRSANARLIAAAPSLLKALEDLLASDLVQLGWLPLPGTPDFPEMSLSLRERAAPIFAARAAIAKARGTQ